MKKIFFYFLGASLLFASCSDESAAITSEKSAVEFNTKSGKANLSLLYKTMIASNEYIDLSATVTGFVAKLNFDNSVALEKEDDLLKWVQANISKTGFSNYTAFVNDWNSIKGKQALVISRFPEFFLGVVENYPNLDFELPVTPDETSADCPCWPQLTTCEYNASQIQTYSIYASMIIGGITGGGTSTGVALAQSNYQMAISSCNSAYDACMNEHCR